MAPGPTDAERVPHASDHSAESIRQRACHVSAGSGSGPGARRHRIANDDGSCRMSSGLRPSHDRPLHGDPYPPARLHPELYLAEFIGTAVLILVGVSVVILMFGQGSPGLRMIPDEGLRLFLTGGLFGSVGALIAISPIGRISGAHINPAVTLAFWLEGKLAWRDAGLYILAQFAGSAVGAVPLLAWGHMGQSI